MKNLSEGLDNLNHFKEKLMSMKIVPQLLPNKLKDSIK